MPSGNDLVTWAAFVFGTGGAAKFALDMISSRSKNRKESAETQVTLVDSTSNYAVQLTERIAKLHHEFEAYRARTEERFRRQDAAFRRHGYWDDQVQRRLAELGEQVPDPPPLYLDA